VLHDQLEHARSLIASLDDRSIGEAIEDPVLPPSYEAIRWFPLRGEASARPA